MQTMSNGVPMSIEDIVRYELPIDNPLVVIQELSEKLVGIEEQFDNEQERADTLIYTNDGLSEAMLLAQVDIDHIIDDINELKMTPELILSIRDKLGEISTKLYEKA